MGYRPSSVMADKKQCRFWQNIHLVEVRTPLMDRRSLGLAAADVLFLGIVDDLKPPTSAYVLQCTLRNFHIPGQIICQPVFSLIPRFQYVHSSSFNIPTE